MATNNDIVKVHVAAAIIFNAGKVLIARRASGSLAGFWEFPGGKIESNESAQMCLVREIREELTIGIVVEEYFGTSTYPMPDKCIILHAYICNCDTVDTLTLNVHNAILWVETKSLDKYDFAPADIVFVNMLQSGDHIKGTNKNKNI